jgi:prevent-host-death family protein
VGSTQKPVARLEKKFLCIRIRNMTIMTIMTLGDSSMDRQVWSVAEAKAKFSEVIERAMSLGPQTITRKGRTAAVVVGAEEWQRKTKRVGNLAEFFAASPLRGSNLKIHRLKSRPRKIDL